MQSPRRILLLVISMVGVALVGWIAAASMAPETRARGNHRVEDQQIATLMEQLQGQEELNQAERLLLLERLIALERLPEAEIVLQPWLAARDAPRQLKLFKAELQRLNGQPEAARRSLQQLMRLHPDHPQVLQLQVLLDQEQGRQSQAQAELNARFKAMEPGQRVEIGLLLADLLRQGGAHQAAVNLYRQLAAEQPTNVKPLLALALLQHERGNVNDVHALLQEARQRRDPNGAVDPLIDVLAGHLGLSAARISSTKQPGSTAIQARSGTP